MLGQSFAGTGFMASTSDVVEEGEREWCHEKRREIERVRRREGSVDAESVWWTERL
jgi:hypothetical protein